MIYVYQIAQNCSSMSMCIEFLIQVLKHKNALGELGSYTLSDTPEPGQLKAPSAQPTMKQLKEAPKGNGPFCKGNRWPRKGNGHPPA